MGAIVKLTSMVKALDPKQRVLAVAASAIILFGGIWILANILPAFIGPSYKITKPSPASQTAYELTAKLNAEERMGSVAFVVQSEDPVRFEIVGMVMSGGDLTRLRTIASEIRPEGDYDIKVDVAR